jgi:hypothetical protein
MTTAVAVPTRRRRRRRQVQVQGDDVLPTVQYIHLNLTKQGGSSAIWSCTMQFDRLVRQLHSLPAIVR